LARAAFLFLFAALDFFVSALALRPLPVLTAAAALVLLALAVCAMYRALGSVKERKRSTRVVYTLCLVLLAHFIKLALPWLLPAAHRPDITEIQRFRHLTFPEFKQDEIRAKQDSWGGRYHTKRLTNGGLLVWSDGPDGDNDNAERPIGRQLFQFESVGYKGWLGHCYLPWQGLLKMAAYWEAVELWGHLDGDIVWEARADGSVSLK